MSESIKLPCPHCNGIGKGDEFAQAGDNRQFDNYCAVCVGRQEIEKRQDRREWVLVQNSDDLVQVWLDYMAKKNFGCYDSFNEPAEYPCLAHIHSEQIADSYGSVIDFFYPGDVPDVWKANENSPDV